MPTCRRRRKRAADAKRSATGGDESLLLGETGLLPAIGCVVLGIAVLPALRREGPPWAELARSARPIM